MDPIFNLFAFYDSSLCRWHVSRCSLAPSVHQLRVKPCAQLQVVPDSEWEQLPNPPLFFRDLYASILLVSACLLQL